MKTVKFRNLLAAGMSASLLFGFFSCTSDEDKIDPVNNQREITFSFDPMTMGGTRTTTNPTYGNDLKDCPNSNENLHAKITLFNDKNSNNQMDADEKLEFDEDLVYDGTKFRTKKPHQIPAPTAADYHVFAVEVHDASHNVVYRALQKDSPLASYVPNDAPLIDPTASLNLKLHNKADVNLWVLCTHNLPVVDFYNPKFNIGITELNCINFYIDRCHPTKGDVHAVGTVYVYEANQAGTGPIDPAKPLYEDAYSYIETVGQVPAHYDFATICFGKEIQNYWIKIVADAVPAEGLTQQVKEFKLTYAELEKMRTDAADAPEAWNKEYNYYDVYFPCTDCGALDCVEFENDVKGPVAFANTEFAKEGWTFDVAPTGMTPAGMEIIERPQFFPEEKALKVCFDSDKKYFSVTSPLFKYTTGKKLNMYFYYEEEVQADQVATYCTRNEYAKVTISAHDAAGNLIAGTADSKTIEIGGLFCNSWKPLDFVMTGFPVNQCVKLNIKIEPVKDGCGRFHEVKVRMDDICVK